MCDAGGYGALTSASLPAWLLAAPGKYISRHSYPRLRRGLADIRARIWATICLLSRISGYRSLEAGGLSDCVKLSFEYNVMREHAPCESLGE